MAAVDDEKMKIVSDGVCYNTKVFLPDGTDITDFVKSVKWEIGANDVATISLELVPVKVSVEVQGKLQELVQKNLEELPECPI